MFTALTTIRRPLVAGAAALLFSAACIGAAVAPAQAAAPQTIEQWQQAVGETIDRMPDDFAETTVTGKSRRAVVAVDLDADGRYLGARIEQPSGFGAFDRHALRVVSRVRYPALPAGYRGQPHTMTVNLLLPSSYDMDGYRRLLDETRQPTVQVVRRAAPDQVAAK